MDTSTQPNQQNASVVANALPQPQVPNDSVNVLPTGLPRTPPEFEGMICGHGLRIQFCVWMPDLPRQDNPVTHCDVGENSRTMPYASSGHRTRLLGYRSKLFAMNQVARDDPLPPSLRHAATVGQGSQIQCVAGGGGRHGVGYSSPTPKLCSSE
ncbi:hypothetical protein PCASD_06227 [Puccinia coronata f. sp. avenae]|uniref:Uncharacterized protein n=1 Tax=Puccinia coronata f. sp. avenae TaxID=200324 RepID=A0A2N5V6L2_9BASI|nr:hypothetical protein PCASD_06227 [Puccinia coronata f. sp. avenae]